MATTHGAFNVVGGLWPLLHRRSFEAVFGPKEDRWLMYTVAGLLTCIGYAQVRAATAEDWAHARRLGVGTATTLLLIDVVNVPRGRIKPTYLIDAAGEAALIVGWVLVSRHSSAAEIQPPQGNQDQQQDRCDGSDTSWRGQQPGL
jgi:hypothetical protein